MLYSVNLAPNVELWSAKMAGVDTWTVGNVSMNSVGNAWEASKAMCMRLRVGVLSE